jgi:hypothetical protein
MINKHQKFDDRAGKKEEIRKSIELVLIEMQSEQCGAILHVQAAKVFSIEVGTWNTEIWESYLEMRNGVEGRIREEMNQFGCIWQCLNETPLYLAYANRNASKQ